MDIGDKVRMLKGNPFGRVGIIKSKNFMTAPLDLNAAPYFLDTEDAHWHFTIEAEGGDIFSAAEDQLELLSN